MAICDGCERNGVEAGERSGSRGRSVVITEETKDAEIGEKVAETKAVEAVHVVGVKPETPSRPLRTPTNADSRRN